MPTKRKLISTAVSKPFLKIPFTPISNLGEKNEEFSNSWPVELYHGKYIKSVPKPTFLLGLLSIEIENKNNFKKN